MSCYLGVDIGTFESKGVLADPDGQRRFFTWVKLAQKDEDYAERYAEHRGRIKDNKAFLATVVGEYKNSRKQDAEISTAGLAARTGVEAALTILPPARAGQVRGVGLPARGRGENLQDIAGLQRDLAGPV